MNNKPKHDKLADLRHRSQFPRGALFIDAASARMYWRKLVQMGAPAGEIERAREREHSAMWRLGDREMMAYFGQRPVTVSVLMVQEARELDE